MPVDLLSDTRTSIARDGMNVSAARSLRILAALRLAITAASAWRCDCNCEEKGLVTASTCKLAVAKKFAAAQNEKPLSRTGNPGNTIGFSTKSC
ncbi:MAG: hypothetical protein AAGL68_10525 [Pseudomonadota bacterium]